MIFWRFKTFQNDIKYLKKFLSDLHANILRVKCFKTFYYGNK